MEAAKCIGVSHIYVFFSSFDEVKVYLQQHLVAVEQSNILEETDKTELYCLYINCLEVCLALKAKPILQNAA